MKTSSSQPTITKKFHIEVPTHTYLSGPAVYKIWFGKKYLIWKGKSMLQSCQYVAENIERYIRLKKDNREDQLFHVCAHIVKTRCIKAHVEVIDTEFTRRGSEAGIDAYKMLMAEQKLLNKADGDDMCLNNNEQAYISNWMPKKDVDKFFEKTEG